MKTGVHKAALPNSWQAADEIIILRPQPDWGVDELVLPSKKPVDIYNTVNNIIDALTQTATENDHVVIMSNKGFGGLHDKLLAALTHELVT